MNKKTKKMLSFLTAAAMTVSSFAGLAITASAATDADILWSNNFDETATGMIADGANNASVTNADMIPGLIFVTGTGKADVGSYEDAEGNTVESGSFYRVEEKSATDKYVHISFPHFGDFGKNGRWAHIDFAADKDTAAKGYAPTADKDVVLDFDVKLTDGMNHGSSANRGNTNPVLRIGSFDSSAKTAAAINVDKDQAQIGDDWTHVRVVVSNSTGAKLYVNQQEVTAAAASTVKAIDAIGIYCSDDQTTVSPAKDLIAGNYSPDDGGSYADADKPTKTATADIDNFVIYNETAGVANGTTEAPGAQSEGGATPPPDTTIPEPEKIAGAAPAITVPERVEESTSIDFNSDEVGTKSAIVTENSVPVEIAGGKAYTTAGIRNSGGNGDSSPFSFAQIVDVDGGSKAVKLTGGRFANGGWTNEANVSNGGLNDSRAPKLHLTDNLPVADGETAVMAFATYLSKSNADGSKARLWLIDADRNGGLQASDINNSASSTAFYKNVFALITAEDETTDPDDTFGSDNNKVIRVEPDKWHVITVTVSAGDKYRIFVDGEYASEDGRLDPVLNLETINYGTGVGYTPANLPVLAIENVGSDVDSSQSKALIDNVVTYKIASENLVKEWLPTIGEPGDQPTPTEAPAPSAAPAAKIHKVTIAQDGQNVTVTDNDGVAEDAYDAVLIHSSYTDGKLDSVKAYNIKVTNGTATQAVPADDEIFEGDKLMVWDSLKGMIPYGSATGKGDAKPTPAPTPTPAPAATPTPSASVEPEETPGASVEPEETPGASVEPEETPGVTVAPDQSVYKFDFGAADAVADGYIGVSADTKYSAATGYGFLGLENGFATSWLSDGFEMTQGYDLKLENGAASAVTSADDDWVATTVRQEMSQDYISPIRFAMSAVKNGYYSVKITLKRADAAQEAKVNLFTERRHQHLLDEPIPAEGLVYETNVYVHNLYGKSNGNHPGDNEDKTLNIVAEGKNVAISSIEVTKQETAGKTMFILTDSTGCEQSAAIPYFPLNHCQGVGSAIAKYLSKDWALVNEGESGLSSGSAKNHWANCKNEVKSGDVVWFEFGHNDQKENNGLENYKTNMAQYYSELPAGAYFLVVSPIQRKMETQYDSSTKKWKKELEEYATAGKAFVEAQIAAGKTNIAFVDLNNSSLGFLDEQTAVINSDGHDYGWRSMNFYYFNTDYTHPNDYGADNFAKLVVDEAKSVIEAAAEDGATDSVTKQAAVFTYIFSDTRDCEANLVSDDIVAAGAGPNSLYPNPLTKVVYYDFPWLLKKIEWNEDGTPKSVTAEPVACEKDIPNSYAKGKVEIFKADGTPKDSVETTGFYDKLSTSGALEFPTTTVTFDAEAGDTYKAYMVDADTSTSSTGTIVSNTLTEKDNIDVKEYLLQGSVGTENKEDFSSYDLTEGESIVGKNGWSNPGGETFAYGEENGLTFAHCVTTGSATYYPEKKFTAQSTGKLYCSLDVRYISGTFNLYFTDGGALNSWPEGRILPLQVVTADGEVQVKLDGTKVATVNSGEWVTYALTIDLDYGTYTLSVNGNTYEAPFTAYQTNEVNLIPSNLSLIAFQNDKSNNEYDVTNIVLAALNTSELPGKTLTVSSSDESQGEVSIMKDGEAVDGKTVTATMNSLVTATASAKEGFEFVSWNDADGKAVSYSPEYEMRLHNDTTITAKFQQAVVDPITYLYKEYFSTLSTNTLAGAGWTSTNAQGNMTVEQDDAHGNYLKFAPGNANSRGMTKDFGIEAADNYVVEMDIALTAGNGQDTRFALINSAASNAINDAADNYVFAISTTNSTTWTVNASAEDTVEIPANTWVHLTVIVKDGKVSYKISNGEQMIKEGETTAVGGVDLKGIHLRSGRYNGVTSMDNIRVYTADQYVEE